MIWDESSFEGRLDPNAPLTALKESRLAALAAIKQHQNTIAAFQESITQKQVAIAVMQTEVKLYEDALKKLGASI